MKYYNYRYLQNIFCKNIFAKIQFGSRFAEMDKGRLVGLWYYGLTGQDKGDGTTPGTALLVMIRMIGWEWRMTLVMILVEIVMLLMEIIKGGKLQSLIDVQEFSATFCQNNKMLRRRIVMISMMMRRRRRRMGWRSLQSRTLFGKINPFNNTESWEMLIKIFCYIRERILRWREWRVEAGISNFPAKYRVCSGDNKTNKCEIWKFRKRWICDVIFSQKWRKNQNIILNSFKGFSPEYFLNNLVDWMKGNARCFEERWWWSARGRCLLLHKHRILLSPPRWSAADLFFHMNTYQNPYHWHIHVIIGVIIIILMTNSITDWVASGPTLA